jgi:hypothetical protein
MSFFSSQSGVFSNSEQKLLSESIEIREILVNSHKVAEFGRILANLESFLRCGGAAAAGN